MAGHTVVLDIREEHINWLDDVQGILIMERIGNNAS